MSIYLDWNATTPPRQAAIAAWAQCQEAHWGNPSSIHERGQGARHHYDRAKAELAQLLGCRPSQLVLTGSGSEANNLAIHAALAGQTAGQVVAAAIDHSSVLRPLKARTEHSLQLIGVDQAARIDSSQLAAALDGDTRLVSLQYANNETGTCQDLATLIAVIRERAPQAKILCDACQGVGKSALKVSDLDVDFLTVAGHKFGAPKGLGILVCKQPGPLAALIHGGQQQQDRRSGTEDVAGAVAMASALMAACAEQESEEQRQRHLLETTFSAIAAQLPAARWIAHEAPRLSNTLSLAHPGVESDALVMRLDLEGICVSRGSACMAARRAPSHVIAALGIDANYAQSVIRISIGHGTSAADLEHLVKAYVRCVTTIQQSTAQ